MMAASLSDLRVGTQIPKELGCFTDKFQSGFVPELYFSWFLRAVLVDSGTSSSSSLLLNSRANIHPRPIGHVGR
jgi:hypothetical protein